MRVLQTGIDDPPPRTVYYVLAILNGGGGGIMADYVSLVCKDCAEQLSLGKIIWIPDTGKSRAIEFFSGLAGGRGHDHNWQDDDLNYSVYAMLARHCGHRIAVLPIDDMSEMFNGRVSNFPDEPELKYTIDCLAKSPSASRIVSPKTSEVFSLGNPLFLQQASVLFTGYFDQLATPEQSPAIWHFLARQLWQSLIVEIT